MLDSSMGRNVSNVSNPKSSLSSQEAGGDKFDCMNRYDTLKKYETERVASLTANNMLSLQVQNMKLWRDGSYENAMITHNDLFAYLITHYNLEIEAVLSISSANMSTVIHNNLLKYIQFKDSNYNLDYLVGEHMILGHSVSIRRCNTKSKLISFLSGPPYVPDEELIHLLQFYGMLRHDNIVHDVHKDKLANGLMNGTRRIDLELDDRVSIPSFFWLDGVQAGDKSARVTVKPTSVITVCRWDQNVLVVGMAKPVKRTVV